MDEDKDCIFCLDSINTYKEQEILFDTLTKIDTYNTYVSNILNNNITLACNHEFHLGCFIKYIKHKYKSWNRKVSNPYFCVECPICRNKLEIYQILDIIDRLQNIKIVNEYLKNSMFKIKYQMLWEKLKIYSNHYILSFYGKTKVNTYFNLSEAYDEYEFLKNKIRYLLEDMDTIYKNISKCNDYDYDQYFINYI
jgi:hypothetical protein